MNIRFANFNFFRRRSDDGGKPDMTQEAVAARRAREKVIHSIEAQLNEHRRFSERFADFLVDWFGGIGFIILNLGVFVVWLVVNLGWVPGFDVFDPYPFTLLTMVVSLEAIFLSIFVLMSQKRESQVGKLREEIDLQINMITEQEVTKIIKLMAYLMKHFNVPYEKDPELRKMMKPIDIEEIRRELSRQLKLPH